MKKKWNKVGNEATDPDPYFYPDQVHQGIDQNCRVVFMQ